jgi:hypothetical protein
MPNKLSRYERKIARDSQLKAKTVIQLHYHVCTCTKKRLCKIAGCTNKRQASCYNCQIIALQEYEKTRAIEAERNSGTQLTIQFETKSEPKSEYAQYSDFMTWKYAPVISAESIKKAMEEIAKINPAINAYPGKLVSKSPKSGYNQKSGDTSSMTYPYHKYDNMFQTQYSVQHVNKDGNLIPATQGNPFMTPEEIKEVWQSEPISIWKEENYWEKLPAAYDPNLNPKSKINNPDTEKIIKYIPADKAVI